MRYLILSDIHSNEEALSAVLDRVKRRKYDRIVVLGDFVGYGADPNSVIEKITRLRKRKSMIRGNHDKVVCGLDSGELFNPIALRAAQWTAERLTPSSRRFLEDLPIGPLEVDGAFVICHGSPRDEDAYIFSDYDAYLNFTFSEASVCFFGHSHIPSLFALQPHGIRVEVVRGDRERIRLDRRCRYLINPGSIGQPRDRNPDAAFAFYDTSERAVTFERVRYDVEKARDKIHRAGLPGMLGDRLVIGA
jgi:predicted phosphodiesterase